MNKNTTVQEIHTQEHEGSLIAYTIGFILSIGLTLIAYFIVVHHVLSGWGLLSVILELAVAQLIVQLVFFLHLGNRKSHWNIMAFVFMLIVLLIIVIGSIWIMKNLNYNMATPIQTDNAVQKGESAQPVL